MFFSYYDYMFKSIQENLSMYMLNLCIFISLHYIIFRKSINTIADPMIIMLISMVFSEADVIFMYKTSMISRYYFLSFCLTEFALICGLKTFKSIRFNLNNDEEIVVNNLTEGKFTLLYFFIALLFNISSIIAYLKSGFILFSASTQGRISMLVSTGATYRLSWSILPVFIFCIVKSLDENRKNVKVTIINLLNLINVIVYLIFFIASKTGILIFVQIIYFYIIFLHRQGKKNKVKLLKRIMYKMMVITLISVLVVSQIVSNSKGIKDTIDMLIYRFVAYGDIYPSYYMSGMAFGDGGINNGIKLLISPVIQFVNKVLNILSINDTISIPSLIGSQLFEIFINPDLIAGPNSRHNIFGLFYFGFVGSIVFSYLIGFFISFIRNRLYTNRLSYVKFLYYIILVNGSLTLVTDPNLGMNAIIIGVVLVYFINLISIIIYYIIKKIGSDNRIINLNNQKGNIIND